MKKCDIGLVGLAVMGENLVMNMIRNGTPVLLPMFPTPSTLPLSVT